MADTEQSIPERTPIESKPARGVEFATATVFFLATLALRLTFLFRSQDTSWPHSVLYEGDAPVWAQWAALLAAGQPFEDDLPFRTPGVAFLLHWLGMTAAPFTAAKVVWAVMSAATTSTIFLVLSRWFGRLAATIAAMLTMISFGSFALATSLNNEVPYALLVTITLGLTLAWVATPATRRSIVIGLLHGVCMLLRAEHLALLAMLGAWSMVTAWRRGTRPKTVLVQSALVGAAAVLACVPWMLRSHAATSRFNTTAPVIVYERSQPAWTPGAIAMFRALPAFAQGPNYAFLSDLARRERWSQVDEVAVHRFFDERWGSTPEPLPEWSLVSFKGPLDFALSNDLRGDGGFSRAALADAESPDPLFSLARPSHAHLVNHGYAVGWNSIRSDPARWSKLVGEKLMRFTDGATLGLFPKDWPHRTTHVRHAIDIAVPQRGDAPVWNTAVLALTAIGAIVAFGTPGGGALLVVLAYRLLVIVAFYGYARHAASIGPVLWALVGIAVQWMLMRASRLPALQTRSAGVRRLGNVVCGMLFALALRSAWNPPVWFASPLVRGGQITPTPQWHPDAFEAVDAITIEPMPDSSR